jgi:uncharacterized repeat protein (TIGR03833 family)
MPRNSASGANKQRRRPQREYSDTAGFRPPGAQPGHRDPNIRLDGQSVESSFVHLEKEKESAGRVVGTQGWKTPDTPVKTQTPQDKSIHDALWDHFWSEVPATSTRSDASCNSKESTLKISLENNLRSVPTINGKVNGKLKTPPPATPELPRHDPSIPRIQAVLPGRRADIVLKQDQGSGRTVRGVVAEVLTRGDHPWGIKVRLSDGRVGRVQRIY